MSKKKPSIREAMIQTIEEFCKSLSDPDLDALCSTVLREQADRLIAKCQLETDSLLTDLEERPNDATVR